MKRNLLTFESPISDQHNGLDEPDLKRRRTQKTIECVPDTYPQQPLSQVGSHSRIHTGVSLNILEIIILI
jgi:ethanolamine ammonia-lyase small subunit